MPPIMPPLSPKLKNTHNICTNAPIIPNLVLGELVANGMHLVEASGPFRIEALQAIAIPLHFKEDEIRQRSSSPIDSSCDITLCTYVL